MAIVMKMITTTWAWIGYYNMTLETSVNDVLAWNVLWPSAYTDDHQIKLKLLQSFKRLSMIWARLVFGFRFVTATVKRY